MSEVITIGLDLAKSVFQVHGVDVSGEAVIRNQLRRRQVLPFFKKLAPYLVGMEACATAHHWARQLEALGHQVRLMPPRYVKAYVRRNKNDGADAAAICEAVTRPTMRFVAVKSAEQQSVLMLHRSRAHLAELGIVARVGMPQVNALLAVIADEADDRLPPLARSCLQGLAAQLMSLEGEIAAAGQRIHAWHRSNEASRRLETIPGIGPITASALAATITDPSLFRSGRELAAWIGLVPRQTSTGGKARLGRISKQGDPYLRWLLVVGAMTVIRHAKRRGTANPWLAELIAHKPTKVAAVALANKLARIAWALLRDGGTYQTPAAAAVA